MTVIVHTLNEMTAPAFVWRALTGRRPVLMAVEAILQPLQPLLTWLGDWAMASGRAAPASSLCPELAPLESYPTRVLLHDVYGRLEPAHDTYFDCETIDRACPGLALVYRQVTCNHVRWKHHAVLIVEALTRTRSDVRFAGLSPDTAALAEALCGVRPPSWPPALRLVNPLIWLALTLAALGWTLSRIRRRVEPRPVFLAADYIADGRDTALYDELAEGGPVLLVPREPSRRVPPDLAARHRVADPGSGRLDSRGGLDLLGEVLRDAGAALRHFHHLEPAHFWRMAAIPYKRARLRAFFSLWRPRYFWGRDDYNVEHLLRRDECHRAGGLSFGINHGYPVYSHRFPMWRYIGFDRYYVFGTAIYRRYLKDRWAADMAVVPAGTFGASREEYRRRFAERPGDILVLCAVAIGEPALIGFVRGLAEAFPDRRILLQVKHLFVDTPEGRRLVEESGRGLPNVERATGRLFELFGRARYVFSDPSTALVEAIQFGNDAFAIDICPYQRVSILREFDRLCVRSADEAAERIRDIESGRVPYGRHRYGELIDLSGRVLADIVREDMGLAPREPARPLPDARCPMPGNDR